MFHKKIYELFYLICFQVYLYLEPPTAIYQHTHQSERTHRPVLYLVNHPYFYYSESDYKKKFLCRAKDFSEV